MNDTILRGIGVAGVLLNAIGVYEYLAHVGVFGPVAEATGETVMLPSPITAAFAIAVFGGIIGSLGLVLLARWARPVLWIALVATVIDWGWVLANVPDASVPMGVGIMLASLGLAVVAERGLRVRGI